MKKVTFLTFAAIVYFASFTYATDPKESREENYDWLVEEIDFLTQDDLSLKEVKTTVFIYDKEGNEVVNFEEAAYDTLSVNLKRTMNKSEFLFETKGDKVYILSE